MPLNATDPAPEALESATMLMSPLDVLTSELKVISLPAFISRRSEDKVSPLIVTLPRVDSMMTESPFDITSPFAKILPDVDVIDSVPPETSSLFATGILKSLVVILPIASMVKSLVTSTFRVICIAPAAYKSA